MQRRAFEGTAGWDDIEERELDHEPEPGRPDTA
jgi:hypothetical protein